MALLLPSEAPDAAFFSALICNAFRAACKALAYLEVVAAFLLLKPN